MHRPPAHGGLGRMYPRPAPAAPPPVSAEDLEVLVAEDNIMMASLMQLQLRQLGYRSHLCANGQEVGPRPPSPLRIRHASKRQRHRQGTSNFVFFKENLFWVTQREGNRRRRWSNLLRRFKSQGGGLKPLLKRPRTAI